MEFWMEILPHGYLVGWSWVKFTHMANRIMFAVTSPSHLRIVLKGEGLQIDKAKGRKTVFQDGSRSSLGESWWNLNCRSHPQGDSFEKYENDWSVYNMIDTIYVLVIIVEWWVDIEKTMDTIHVQIIQLVPVKFQTLKVKNHEVLKKPTRWEPSTSGMARMTIGNTSPQLAVSNSSHRSQRSWSGGAQAVWWFWGDGFWAIDFEGRNFMAFVQASDIHSDLIQWKIRVVFGNFQHKYDKMFNQRWIQDYIQPHIYVPYYLHAQTILHIGWYNSTRLNISHGGLDVNRSPVNHSHAAAKCSKPPGTSVEVTAGCNMTPFPPHDGIILTYFDKCFGVSMIKSVSFIIER